MPYYQEMYETAKDISPILMSGDNFIPGYTVSIHREPKYLQIGEFPETPITLNGDERLVLDTQRPPTAFKLTPIQQPGGSIGMEQDHVTGMNLLRDPLGEDRFYRATSELAIDMDCRWYQMSLIYTKVEDVTLLSGHHDDVSHRLPPPSVGNSRSAETLRSVRSTHQEVPVGRTNTRRPRYSFTQMTMEAMTDEDQFYGNDPGYHTARFMRHSSSTGGRGARGRASRRRLSPIQVRRGSDPGFAPAATRYGESSLIINPRMGHGYSALDERPTVQNRSHRVDNTSHRIIHRPQSLLPSQNHREPSYHSLEYLTTSQLPRPRVSVLPVHHSLAVATKSNSYATKSDLSTNSRQKDGSMVRSASIKVEADGRLPIAGTNTILPLPRTNRSNRRRQSSHAGQTPETSQPIILSDTSILGTRTGTPSVSRRRHSPSSPTLSSSSAYDAYSMEERPRISARVISQRVYQVETDTKSKTMSSSTSKSRERPTKTPLQSSSTESRYGISSTASFASSSVSTAYPPLGPSAPSFPNTSMKNYYPPHHHAGLPTAHPMMVRPMPMSTHNATTMAAYHDTGRYRDSSSSYTYESYSSTDPGASTHDANQMSTPRALDYSNGRAPFKAASPRDMAVQYGSDVASTINARAIETRALMRNGRASCCAVGRTQSHDELPISPTVLDAYHFGEISTFRGESDFTSVSGTVLQRLLAEER